MGKTFPFTESRFDEIHSPCSRDVAFKEPGRPVLSCVFGVKNDDDESTVSIYGRKKLNF